MTGRARSRAGERWHWLVCLLLATFALGACTARHQRVIVFPEGINVDAVYDPNVDFTQYHTFSASGSTPNEGMLTDLSGDQRGDLQVVNTELARNLKEVGLSSAAPDKADLIAFSLVHTAGARHLTWRCVSGTWGGYWYWKSEYNPCGWLHASAVSVRATTIIVGLVDPSQNEVVFAGFVDGVQGSAQQRKRQIEGGIALIFDQYPTLNAEPEQDAGEEDADVPADPTLNATH